MLAGAIGVGSQVAQEHVRVQERSDVLPGVRIAGYDVGGLQGDALTAVAGSAAIASLDRPLTLVAGTAQTQTTARALGAEPEYDAAVQAARSVGRSGDFIADLQARVAAQQGEVDIPIGYRFVEDRALAHLQAIAPEVERPSLPTRLDLEHRKVLPAERGAALLAYDSMSAIAVGLASGAEHIELVVQPKPPVEDPLADVAEKLDISVLLGSFDTPYRVDASETDRNHNLKVGAAALDGVVLMPGEVLSFNEVVGDRSAENGYRYATGISAGQLIDVLGGGICQISSTLFGAGFFAGLEVLEARPHSRPSSYVDMGLDSTVVWPSVDMKLRNAYEFPVVVHMTVSQGKVRAEVLGPRRPYQIAFERELQEVLPYQSVWRHDDRLLQGTEAVAQQGKRGFVLERRREFYQGGEVVKTERWDLHYPPTTQIVRRGTNPSGEVPEKTSMTALRDPAPSLRIMQ